MQITERSAYLLADLDPVEAEAIRADLARVREPSEDDLRRLAGLLGLRRTDGSAPSGH